MMNCLYCGQPLAGQDAKSGTGWHGKCIRRFFGTDRLPELDLSPEALDRLAEETARKHLTVPGVQKKLSLHLSREEEYPRLTMVDSPAGFILKPQTPQFRCLPEAEDCVMRMADAAGIPAVPHALLLFTPGRTESASPDRSEAPNAGGVPGTHAFITRRIDRGFDPYKSRKSPGGTPVMYAMEDLCQLSLRQTQDKYRGSYERCADVIRRYSSAPGLDLAEFYFRLLFCFVTGNSDMHLKNFSLREKTCGKRDFVLSAAYDLLPVNVVLPEDPDETALTLNGKKRNLRKKDFLAFAAGAGISPAAARRLLSRIISLEARFHTICTASLMPEEMKGALHELMRERFSRLALSPSRSL